MHVCILNHDGEVLLHRGIPATREACLQIVNPYVEDLVVGVECMFTWYWLADLCLEHEIHFVLGHRSLLARRNSPVHQDDARMYPEPGRGGPGAR